MALAMLFPETKQGKKDAALPNLIGKFSAERLRQARSVLRFSRPIAQAVLNGTTPLNDALATVKQQEQYQMGDEAKLARLQASASAVLLAHANNCNLHAMRHGASAFATRDFHCSLLRGSNGRD